MESWDSSNAEHRLTDHAEPTKDVISHDSQNYATFPNHSDSTATHLPRSKSSHVFGMVESLLI